MKGAPLYAILPACLPLPEAGEEMERLICSVVNIPNIYYCQADNNRERFCWLPTC
jgi:hypothetical protein